jgi:hypothetical protein
MFRIYTSKAASSSGRRRSRAAVVLVTLAAALIASLVGSEAAEAQGDFPSWHSASAYSCVIPSGSSTGWIMSSVYMNRADGYDNVYSYGGVDYLGNGTGGTLVKGFTKQWLYYRVVVGDYDAYNRFLGWKYGNWMRRLQALGNQTDGVTTEVQMDDGSWVSTAYTIPNSIFDLVATAEDLTRWDVSIAKGLVPGWKLVYAEMWWGPIYQTVPGPTTLVFDWTRQLERLGWEYCR